MEATHFSWQREKIFLLKRRHSDVTCARNLPQRIHCRLPDPTMPLLTL